MPGDEWARFTAAELERLAGGRDGAFAFHRSELRRTSHRRELQCGCIIDARELYLYSVAKVYGVAELQQTTECDCCMRSSHRY